MNKLKLTAVIVTLIGTLLVSSCGCIRTVKLNDFESSILELINNERIQNNLNPLIPDQKLTNLAKSRCTDMVTRNYFSHYTPEGKRIRCAEILGRSNFKGTSEMFLSAWLDSQIHKDVILNPTYKRIGISITDNEEVRIITIIFSSRRW